METLVVELGLRSDEEIVQLRQRVRDQAVAQKFSLIDQTKFVTAASELARNTLDYGGGGEVGDGVSVDYRGTRFAATVHAEPVVDPDMARIKR